MAVTPVSPDTGTGVELSVVPPLPTSPSAPDPQARTVPSLSSAYPVPAPAAMGVTPAMAVTPVSPDTGTGVELFVVPPLPNSPSAPYPQARTVPFLSSAYPAIAPAAMAVTPVSPDTGTGVELSMVQPLPNWPREPDPQADAGLAAVCLLYTSPSPRDGLLSRMPSSA